MRKQIGLVALVIAVGVLGWAWGDRKRTEHELNTVYYPTLYSEVILAIDPVTKESVNFEIKLLDEVSPSLKGTEPTRILKYPDKSQAVTLVRRHDRKQYSFEIHAPGYGKHTISIKPAESYLRACVADEVLQVVLTPVEVGRGNFPKED